MSDSCWVCTHWVVCQVRKEFNQLVDRHWNILEKNASIHQFCKKFHNEEENK